MSESERRQQPLDLNGSVLEYPLACAHEQIDEQAYKNPDHIALVYKDNRVSYASLTERSNRIARYLQKLGIGPETMVGLCLERSADAIIALLGILKAGGAYVPLDPDLPQDRLNQMIRDAGLPLIVTTSKLIRYLPASVSRLICLDKDFVHFDLESSDRVESMVGLENAAYVCFTSGSTGVPKGVVHTHRQLIHYRPPVSEGNIWILNVALNFGFSMARLFPPLFSGLPLVIVPDEKSTGADELVGLIEREKVTNIGLVPSALEQLIALTAHAPARLRHIRSVNVAGASVTAELMRAFASAMPDAKLFYGYGATEVGPITIDELSSSSDHRNIGRPLPNTQVLILDDVMNPVPVGVTGEVYVGSTHLARGYLNQPELTAERFIPNPFRTSWSGDRLFRTGDLARYLPSGQLELVGRSDRQVKYRGFRIELEEVERALQAHPDVKEAAVSVEDLAGEQRLIAYCVTTDSAKPPRVSELREHLLGLLPEYMLPSLFMIVEALPLTSTGKVDRSALPIPSPVRPDLDTL